MNKLLFIPLLILIVAVVGFYLIKTDHPQSEEAQGIVDKISLSTQKAFERAKTWSREHIWPYLSKWLSSKKSAIKEGIEEEKEELKQDARRELNEMWDSIQENLWGKMKAMIFSSSGESEEPEEQPEK